MGKRTAGQQMRQQLARDAELAHQDVPVGDIIHEAEGVAAHVQRAEVRGDQVGLLGPHFRLDVWRECQVFERVHPMLGVGDPFSEHVGRDGLDRCEVELRMMKDMVTEAFQEGAVDRQQGLRSAVRAHKLESADDSGCFRLGPRKRVHALLLTTQLLRVIVHR